MNYLKGFFVSLSIHLLVLALFILGTRNIVKMNQETKAVDISALIVAKPAAKPAPKPVTKPAVKPQPKKAVIPPHEKPQTKPTPQKKIEKVTAPPVTPEKIQKPVVTQEPKLVSDAGMKEYVPVAVPETAKLEKYNGSGYVGTPSASKPQNTAPVVAASTGESSASKYMRINIEALRKSIYSKLVYPRQAKMMGMKGVTDLRFRIHKNGSVDRVEVHKSSGYDLLDDAAKDAVIDAAPLPAPSDDVTIVLSVNFSLR